MAAHITYLSKKGLQEKFGRKLQEREDLKFGFDADFQIESYLQIVKLAFLPLNLLQQKKVFLFQSDLTSLLER